ncbi:MAG TPA: hypothetical protein DCF63_13660 [Planctomycetaceae bacterium]|nr:hypothetical protein [Planctomycetaceae bacterium]
MNDSKKTVAIPPFNDLTKNRSRNFGKSMTAEAILERLQTMSDLSRFCHELGQAKRIGKVNELLEH